VQKLGNFIAKNEKKLSIRGTVGSSFAFIVYSIFKNLKRSIFLIFSDKEEATYFLNDVETIDENLNILFFPSIGREPYNDYNISTYNLLQRTEVLNYLYRNESEGSIIITYNDAITEKILLANELNKLTLEINLGQHISLDYINSKLFELNFRKEDFVSQPGDFSVRGGIVDVFSFLMKGLTELNFLEMKLVELGRLILTHNYLIQIIHLLKLLLISNQVIIYKAGIILLIYTR